MAISLDNESVARRSPELSRHAVHAAASASGDEAERMQGPEHFRNLPNSITMLRAGVVPVLLVFPLFTGGVDGGPSEFVSTRTSRPDWAMPTRVRVPASPGTK